MCGIAGLVGFVFSEKELQKHIESACRALHHRGPDQQGFYVDKGVALGVSRLAIRDPEHGTQPMTRQGLTLVFNGELYDIKPLKDKLLQAGSTFETDCDTEIFLNAFLQFGPSVVSELVGMFAFALWDRGSKTLYLGRDRWGEKPLYYTSGEGFLAFASEIKGLKSWPHLKWDMNLEDIPIFLKNSYLPHPRTGWKNLFKLEPGSILIWQEGQLAKNRYFSPSVPKEKTLKSPEQLFHLLDLSVKNCSVSDRPVGVFLSGGIDSTTIAYLLSKNLENISAFSLHWDDETYSEQLYFKEAARALGVQHNTVKCDPSFFLSHFDLIAGLYDEPFADESMVPMSCLARFAKEQVDVVLTGDGADEFFHGYERYFFKGEFKKYLEVFAATSTETLKLICHPDLMKYDKDSLFLSSYSQEKPYIDKDRLKSWVDINTYLTDDILMKVDRACMGVGLEARAPFLMPQMTDFALSCSIKQLIGPGPRGKEILRLAMKDHLPQLILERKKMGFGVPLNHWFRTSLKEWMTLRLLEGELLKTCLFSRDGITKLISSPNNHSRTIFNLLVLDVWLKNNR